MRLNGDLVFGRVYEGDGGSVDLTTVPAFVKACLVLLSSSTATVRMRPYTLEQDGSLWVYCLFESFAIVVEATAEEPLEWLGRRIITLGKEIARTNARVIASWSGGPLTGSDLSDLLDRYIHFGASNPSPDMVRQIETLVSNALAEQNVVYIGVFDAAAEMIAGNVPENHIAHLRPHIVGGTARPGMDIVPTTVEIDGYSVQLIRIHSLTVVAAPYPSDSHLHAARVVADLANSINKVIE